MSDLMQPFDPESHPHRRYNPLAGEFVLVSPHRGKRPWQGQQETSATNQRPSYDPECYLCPGNHRANGEINPEYAGTFVFQNDFSALLSTPYETPDNPHPLYQAGAVTGECRVICFSPDHRLTLATMHREQILEIVRTWIENVSELSKKYRWVQVFENKGAAMGCSNPHPHGQIWASGQIPTIVQRESEQLRRYFENFGHPMLQEVVRMEKADGSRIVSETEHWLAIVPFWATWPFEVLLLPKHQHSRLETLSENEQEDLAEILRQITCRYDNLFESEFPYSFGWHFAPSDDENPDAWTIHAHFFPPLLRSSMVRKFLVGYEMLAESQRDITPEIAASRLAALPIEHFSKR